MAEICKDLPDECWEIIFGKMGHHSNFQALILVCRRFLSVIRQIRTTFKITVPTLLIHGENLFPVLNQFPSIKNIDLQEAGDSTPWLLDLIAMSSLNVQSLDISKSSCLSLSQFQVLGKNMKSLKVLNCSKMLGLTNEGLEVITNSVPWLEELDISRPIISSEQDMNVDGMTVTDKGIEILCSKLKGLRKINISGNQFVTDKSLMALSSNCMLLEEVVAQYCPMITVAGIQFLVSNSPNLTSLSVNQIDLTTPSSNLFTGQCSSFARRLSNLEIENAGVSNKFLYCLSESGIPLKKFTLNHCDGFGYEGIAALLKKYPSLEYLSLIEVPFPDDVHVLEELSGCFSKLTTIKLKVCNITEATFFMLVKNGPLLENIDMGNTLMGTGDSTIAFVSNPRIKTLNLSCNLYLSDECLAKLVLACPFVEIVEVSYCSKLTEQGISNILNRCSKLRHLEINGCERVMNIGEGNELPKLEVLSAQDSGLDREGLAMIGKRCHELLNLNLGRCMGLTNEGLKTMLGDCRRLREINLSQCVCVGREIIDWMVFTKPSLRKIVPPFPYLPDVCKMQFYLRHGCYVSAQPVDKEYKLRKYCYHYVMRLRDQSMEING